MVFACKHHINPSANVPKTFHYPFVGFLCPYNVFQDVFSSKNTNFSSNDPTLLYDVEHLTLSRSQVHT